MASLAGSATNPSFYNGGNNGHRCNDVCVNCDYGSQALYVCSRCDGSGYDPVLKCRPCKGSGHVYITETCQHCENGTIIDKYGNRVNCYACGGSGKHTYKGFCSSCGGEGRAKCSKCHGSGKVARN